MSDRQYQPLVEPFEVPGTPEDITIDKWLSNCVPPPPPKTGGLNEGGTIHSPFYAQGSAAAPNLVWEPTYERREGGPSVAVVSSGFIPPSRVDS